MHGPDQLAGGTLESNMHGAPALALVLARHGGSVSRRSPVRADRRTEPMVMALTAAQHEQFVEQGAVVFEPHISPTLIDAVEGVLDSHCSAPPHDDDSGPEINFRPVISASAEMLQPPLVEAISHPIFEKVAQELLRADSVRLNPGYKGQCVYPEHARHPGVGPFSSVEECSTWHQQNFLRHGGHVDAEYCLQHWHKTPRQIFMQFWLCIDDWTEEKGALRIIPASHTLIAAANSALVEPPPSRVAGVHGKSSSSDSADRPLLPEDVRGMLQQMQSQPVLARRGQAVAFTPGLLHGSSPNLTTDGVRKRLTFTYCPGAPALVGLKEPAVGLVTAMCKLLPAERRHLVDNLELMSTSRL